MPLTAEYYTRNSSNKTGFRAECKECRHNNTFPKWKTAIKIDSEGILIKMCSKCKQYFPATTDYFRANKYEKTGLECRCKTCAKEHDSLTYNRTEEKKRYFTANKDKIISLKKAYIKECYKKNPQKFFNYAHKRKALKNQLPCNFSIEEWEDCKKHFNTECAYCGTKASCLSRDHFVPITKQGEYTKNNIIPACKTCNSSKGNKDFFNWYEKQPFYQAEREKKILEYLGYKDGVQQLSISI